MLPPGPPRSGWVQQVAGANRRWRCQFRYRGSRRESAVAQLFSLGSIAHFMFGLFKKKPEAKAGEKIASQPPGVIFPWPKGVVLTALDEATIALPMAIFSKDEPIGSVVLAPADIQINIPKTGDTFFIRV